MKEVKRIRCGSCSEYHKVTDTNSLITTYSCEICNEEFCTKEEASNCEARGKIEPEYPIGTEMVSKRNEPPDHKQVVYYLGEVTAHHHTDKHDQIWEYLVAVKGNPDEHLYTVQPGQSRAAVALAALFKEKNITHLP